MSQIEGQDKNSEEQLSDGEEGYQLEKEFRVIIVKIVQDLRKRVEAQTKRIQEMFILLRDIVNKISTIILQNWHYCYIHLTSEDICHSERVSLISLLYTLQTGFRMFYMGLSQVFTLSISPKDDPSKCQEHSNNNRNYLIIRKKRKRK